MMLAVLALLGQIVDERVPELGDSVRQLRVAADRGA